jgi:lysophospholipid hydrolase
VADPSDIALTFPGLAPDDLLRLAGAADELALPAGTTLFSEGDAADGFYILLVGALEVLVRDDEVPHRVAVLHPGEMVGEMAVLHGSRRTASVRSILDSTLLRVSAERAAVLFEAVPSIRDAIADTVARRLPSLYLASVPIFAGLEADALEELDVVANWVRLDGGSTLFEQGDSADYLYVLVRGRLEILVARPDGSYDVTGHLARGAVVGEVAFLTGGTRTATVRALRDSELIRLTHAALKQLIARHPAGAMEMLRVLASRVKPSPPPLRHTLVSTIAVKAVGAAPLPHRSTERLIAALSAIGGTTLHVTPALIETALGTGTLASLDEASSRRRVSGWLAEQENRFRYVVLDCQGGPPAWTELCLRQADLVLLAADARSEPPASAGEPQPASSRNAPAGRSVVVELILLHGEDTVQPSGTARWLTACQVSRHHHIRVDRDADYARVARVLAGRCVTAVFSGGGARALGHIGVLQALQQCGVPIDAVAGVSAGCFASGLFAMGHDPERLAAIAHNGVGRYSAFAETTIPIVSFLSGRRSVELLRSLFEADIEDLWIPFFCLSSNLTRAEIVVHDRGRLWRAVRASCAVPGVHVPVCVNGELLVDGGVLNNLPADVMRARFGGTVIASDVSLAVELTTDIDDLTEQSGWSLAFNRLRPAQRARRGLPHIFEILLRTATLSSVHHGSTVVDHADLYMRLPVDEVRTLDWAAGPALVERCRIFAVGEIEAWQRRQSASSS